MIFSNVQDIDLLDISNFKYLIFLGINFMLFINIPILSENMISPLTPPLRPPPRTSQGIVSEG